MKKYRVVFTDKKRPGRIEADWYRQSGDFIHFYVRRSDGGGQTVWRVPASRVAEVQEDSTA